MGQRIVDNKPLSNQLMTEQRFAYPNRCMQYAMLLERKHDIGHANGIEVDPAKRGFRAVADANRDGGNAGAYQPEG